MGQRGLQSPLVGALEDFLQRFLSVSDVLLDSYFVCDHERTIVDYNRAFFALFPRTVARTLKGKKCYEVLALNICKDRCIAEACWREKRQVRLDEIEGQPQDGKKTRFILSALPIFDDAGNVVGALELQRDVTDEATVQEKYQEILDHEARERERLVTQLRARTSEMLEANQMVLALQRELLDYKKGVKL